VIEQALVWAEGRVGDLVEDRAVVGASDARVQVGREGIDLVAGERRFVARSDAKSAW